MGWIGRITALAVLTSLLTAAPPTLGASARSTASSDPPVAVDRVFYSLSEKTEFDLFGFLATRAPHLLPYEEAISHWCGATTISPRIALVLIELQSGLVSAERLDPALFSRPLGNLSAAEGFVPQLRSVLTRLSSELYRSLSPEVSPAVGRRRLAASTALARLLSPTPESPDHAAEVLRSVAAAHAELFPHEPPLSRSLTAPLAPRAAPDNFLQLPFPVGEIRYFSGLHTNGGSSSSAPLSSIDFFPGSSDGAVAASHSGRVRVYSSCSLEVLGEGGWSTFYYHLSGIAVEDGQEVSRNQHLAVYARDRAQGLCNGGSWGSPHLHFSLRRDGRSTELDGSELSGWRVHAGRFAHDEDCTHYWLEEGDRRLCVRDPILNQGFQRRLTVRRRGGGGGSVTSSPDGIDCGSRCSDTFRRGGRIELTATPDPGSELARWRGAGCSGTGSCSVTLLSDTVVTAEFRESEPEEPDPWLSSPALPGFRVRARVSLGDASIDGTRVPDCVADTLCIAGALPGRAEVFVRIVGPKPNGYLWPTLVKFSTSPVDVWIERVATGEIRQYELGGVVPGEAVLDLDGLADKEGFAADAGAASRAGRGQPGGRVGLRTRTVAAPAPPPGPWLESPSLPGFRTKVRITAGGVELAGTAVADCLGETICIAGALPARVEVFVRVVGPKPNSRLWPTLVKFSTSRVEVWLEQLSTGEIRYHALAPAVTGERLITLQGLADRLGFQP